MTIVTLVVARADNGVIGKDGSLPWHLRGDLQHFKRGDHGQADDHGPQDLRELPGSLPGRRHIVLTRDPDWARRARRWPRDEEAALALAGDVPRSR